MSELTVVTVSNRRPTQDYYVYDEFYKSLNGTGVLVLGKEHGEYTGLSDKPRLLYWAIKNKQINTKYTLFCDSWDFIFAFSPTDILVEYKLRFGGKLVISSERNCFPADLKDEYDKLPFTSTFKYLNSGFILGETEMLLAALEAMEAPNLPRDYHDHVNHRNIHYNDQEIWQHLYLKQPVPMALDYNQNLCCCLHSTTLDDFDLSQKRIVLKETGETPSSFHFNGNAKSENNLRPTILKHLNLL